MISYMNISYLDTCKTFSRELKVFKLRPKIYTELFLFCTFYEHYKKKLIKK